MTAGSSAEAWAEFGNNWRDLARRLGDRYRDLGKDQAQEAAADKDKLDDAMRTLSEHLNRAFTSFGEAVRDEETQATLERVASSFGQAMAATFADLGEEVRRAADRAADERRQRREARTGEGDSTSGE